MSVAVCKTFSAAASVAPIKMWSGGHQGSVYLCVKNSFLDFYTDETKEIKRNACNRSCSADSAISKGTRGRNNEVATSASTRSPSPSTPPSTCTDTDFADSPIQRQVWPQKATVPSIEVPMPALHYSEVPFAGYSPSYNVEDMPSPGYPNSFISLAAVLPAGSQTQSQPHHARDTCQKSGRTRDDKRKWNLSKFRADIDSDVTTVMIRGLPCSLNKDRLMEIMDQAGLAEKYDFFYLPMAGGPGSANGNLGYAFVNFVDPVYVAVCKAAMDGVALDAARSAKICTISAADVQGLRNLRKHFRRTAVSRSGQGPIFLKAQDHNLL